MCVSVSSSGTVLVYEVLPVENGPMGYDGPSLEEVDGPGVLGAMAGCKSRRVLGVCR